MNNATTGLGLLSTALLDRVDGLSDRFERDWRAGLRPRLEDQLAGATEPERSVVLHELLVAELDCRRQLGESPDSDEYRARFPSHISVVEAAFAHERSSTEGWERSSLASDGMVGSRFQILGPLAEGGLGVVSVALDAELDRDVALKEIQQRFASRREARERFVREAMINGRLEHPGIVPVYSFGNRPDGRPYYAMRLVEGVNLKDAIDALHGREQLDTRQFELRKLLDRFRGVCEAVAYAHSRGVVHRDVKPQNILLGPFGETFLIDWGLAKWTEPPAQSEHGPEEPQDGSVAGTPPYMSPEQVDGRQELVGPTSDVYGLGATLYHMLTGEPPFQGGITAVLTKVRRGEFPRPRTLGAHIPRALEAICLKAMALRPADRYASAVDLADDIARWQADEPVAAWSEPWSLRALRWIKRHRAWAFAFVLALFLTTLALGICVLWWCTRSMEMA